MRIDKLHTETVMGALEARDTAHTIGFDDPDWKYVPTKIGPGRYVIRVYERDGTYIGTI